MPVLRVMFERRLKVFLGVLLLMTVTLVLRAAQVQVVQHKLWEGRAVDAAKRSEQVETRRGAIRDVKGFVMATDEPCVDACVDYRALAPDPGDKAWLEWVTELARGRLRDRHGAAYTKAPLDRRRVMVDAEVEAVRKDIREMIPRLARIVGRDEVSLEHARTAVVEKVRMRRRFLWYRSYQLALRKHETDVKQAQSRPSSLWEKWLLDDAGEVPEVDQYKTRVAEETARHVLVRDVELEPLRRRPGERRHDHLVEAAGGGDLDRGLDRVGVADGAVDVETGLAQARERCIEERLRLLEPAAARLGRRQQQREVRGAALGPGAQREQQVVGIGGLPGDHQHAGAVGHVPKILLRRAVPQPLPWRLRRPRRACRPGRPPGARARARSDPGRGRPSGW